MRRKGNGDKADKVDSAHHYTTLQILECGFVSCQWMLGSSQ